MTVENLSPRLGDRGRSDRSDDIQEQVTLLQSSGPYFGFLVFGFLEILFVVLTAVMAALSSSSLLAWIE